MNFDVLLPSVLFIVVISSIILQRRMGRTIRSLFEERRLGIREVALIVAWMGGAVTALVFIPGEAIRILFLAAYSYMIFSFTYIALRRWYIAVIPPFAFLFSYFFYWNIVVFNIFVVVFSVTIVVYASGFFSWRTVWAFGALLTVMDVIHVFFTGFMSQSAKKMVGLKLPVLLKLPTFPPGSIVWLGLGDLFLAGLLSIHVSVNRGLKAGVITAIMNSLAMFIFELVMLNGVFVGFFPATLVVMAGSLAGLGVTRLMDRA